MNIYVAKGGYLRSTEVTHIYLPRVLSCLPAQSTVSRAEGSAETSSRLQKASSVDGGLSIGRTLQADGASPDDFRGLPEDNFRFTVAHADRGLFEARKEGYLGDRQRILSDQLKAVSGRRRI